MYNYYMKQALEEAKKALALDEVPIGAIIVKNNEIIAKAYNLRETLKDPTAHAEMLAIRKAAQVLGGWRLTGCDLYVTVEPCPMCAGAILLARIDQVIIGTMDKKGGAAGSLYNILQDDRLNHQSKICTGVLEEECSFIMREFFKALRKK
jgi:tRNA(adenine34) deaminase